MGEEWWEPYLFLDGRLTAENSPAAFGVSGGAGLERGMYGQVSSPGWKRGVAYVLRVWTPLGDEHFCSSLRCRGVAAQQTHLALRDTRGRGEN